MVFFAAAMALSAASAAAFRSILNHNSSRSNLRYLRASMAFDAASRVDVRAVTLIYNFSDWGTYTCCFKKCCCKQICCKQMSFICRVTSEADKRDNWFEKKYYREHSRKKIDRYYEKAFGGDKSNKPEETKNDNDDIEAGRGEMSADPNSPLSTQ